MSDTLKNPPAGAGRALVPFVAPRDAGPSAMLRNSLWAAGLVGAFALGALGVHHVQAAWASPDRASVQAEANARLLQQLEGEIGRLKGSVDTLRTADGARQDDSLRNLKRSVETLKAEVEQVRAADGATLAQISTKIDKVDHDPTQKLADIVARLDRIEHEPATKAADPAAPKVADLSSRLDRLERQGAAAPAPAASTAPAVHPAATSSVPRSPPATSAPKLESTATGPAPAPVVAAKPLPDKPPTVGAWVVRDVYDGLALVEARRGGLREVGPGEFLPGAGQVRAIERRGRDWVVLTSRGVIEATTF